MKIVNNLLAVAFLCMAMLPAMAQQPVPQRSRILISTDIGGTAPDDNQSMAQCRHAGLGEK